ncbi:MAG TPA: DMT family transporter [Xanthobacteraceae bacterium]|jgi:drug/metabolite transporter (DMT)-like permease
MLGAVLAVLSAATFAFNNAAARRGVITGTPIQGMAITIPVGLVGFVPIALITGLLARFPHLAPRSVAWMAGVGLLHFLIGRYCNYRANQAAGVNLTAPVVQLQVFVSVVLAVIILGEPCTVLQLSGGIVMLAGALLTQRQPVKSAKQSAKKSVNLAADAAGKASVAPVFVPHRAAGYTFATLAALAYGTSPIMARTALAHTDPLAGIFGGLISYGAATAAMLLSLLVSSVLRRNLRGMHPESLRWFVYSGVFVAIAQGLFYSALAIAPIMLVAPLMQLSLIFRFGFANTLTPDHELFGWHVAVGAALSILGACLVSVSTDLILHALHLPASIDAVLSWRVSRG